LANREGLKAAEIREEASQVQEKSLKLFETAYRKMAKKNTGSNSGSDSPNSSGSDSQEEPKKEEQK
jgi:hypothetical protein